MANSSVCFNPTGLIKPAVKPTFSNSSGVAISGSTEPSTACCTATSFTSWSPRTIANTTLPSIENTTALIVLCNGRFSISATASIVLALGVSTIDNS